jgi:hypothetical protein
MTTHTPCTTAAFINSAMALSPRVEGCGIAHGLTAGDDRRVWIIVLRFRRSE